MNRAESLRILVADDHKGFRKSVISFLRQMPGIEVIGEAGNGEEAMELIPDLAPDIVLMDIMMPQMNGIEATIIIKKQQPSVRIFLYSMYDTTNYDLEGLRAADIFIPKERLFEELPKILMPDSKS